MTRRAIFSELQALAQLKLGQDIEGRAIAKIYSLSHEFVRSSGQKLCVCVDQLVLIGRQGQMMVMMVMVMIILVMMMMMIMMMAEVVKVSEHDGADDDGGHDRDDYMVRAWVCVCDLCVCVCVCVFVNGPRSWAQGGHSPYAVQSLCMRTSACFSRTIQYQQGHAAPFGILHATKLLPKLGRNPGRLIVYLHPTFAAVHNAIL